MLLRGLHLWHLTSLDAPTVAVVWSSAFAWAAGVRVPAWSRLLLALVAWAVYIGDRLLDARAGLKTPGQYGLRERHRFHWRHRWGLTACGAVAAATSAWMVATLLPAAARVTDSAVGVATLAYFSGVHARQRIRPAHRLPASLFSKEFLVGVLFTAGCLLPAWTRLRMVQHGSALIGAIGLPAAYFAALAWLNCTGIAQWESASDGQERRVRRFGYALGAAGLAAALVVVPIAPRTAILLGMGAVSAALLGVLDSARERISAVTLRAAADLVLLTPLLIVLPMPGGR